VRAEAAGPAVAARGARRVGQQRPARGEPAQARRRDRAGAGLVAAAGVVRPPLVPADVDGAGGGGGGIPRVTAGGVQPLGGQPGGRGAGEGGGRVAQPGEREGAVPAGRVFAGGGEVDGGLVGRPGRGFDVERVGAGAVLAELGGGPVADVAVVSAQVEQEDLLTGPP